MPAGHWYDIALGAGGVVAVGGALWGVAVGLHRLTVGWLQRHTQGQIEPAIEPVRAELSHLGGKVDTLRVAFDSHAVQDAVQFAALGGTLDRIEKGQALSHDQIASVRQDQAVQGTKLDTVLLEVNRMRDRRHAAADAEHTAGLAAALAREKGER